MTTKFSLTVLFILSLSFLACAQKKVNPKTSKETKITKKTKTTIMPTLDKNIEIITLGAGCFWCVEAVFQELNGVQKVVSGYSGGHIDNPTYEEVCSKESGHAEVCQVYYDTTIIKLSEILEVYWLTHDPTTLNQQGADKGPQYRSVIFYTNDTQKTICEDYKIALNKSGAYANPIITAIEAFTNFYAAEDFHQNYYKNNPNQGYCYYVIKPKLDKFHKVFKNKVKKGE
jgi:peptide-methionine (S)-S-oxide reductase